MDVVKLYDIVLYCLSIAMILCCNEDGLEWIMTESLLFEFKSPIEYEMG